jgi:hypothetical protein
MMLMSLKKVPATVMARKDCLLPARARYALGYLVHGIGEPAPDRPDIPVGKPLSIPHVADLLGVRRKYVRGLLSDAIFKAEFAQALAAARAAYAPAAVHKLGSLINSDDERIALQASKAILGEDAKAPAVQVNVQTNVAGPRIGYAYAPCDRPRAPTIDATPQKQEE